MIRLLFAEDHQTGVDTWGKFFTSVDIESAAIEKLLAEGWTFQGIEHRPAPPAAKGEEESNR